MPGKNTQKTNAPKRKLALIALTLVLQGCTSLNPTPLEYGEIQATAQRDRDTASENLEPITGPISLSEAIARGLKYNLDRRTRLMEEAIAMNQFDLSQYDMLPKLMASIGYRNRDEYATTSAEDSVTGAPSLSNPYISSAREHTTADLGLTWNLLDFGLGYYTAKQSADRVMIASERRRKTMHLLIQDIRTAFWRAASAQKLREEVRSGIVMAESALADARKAEAERLRSPLDALRYQRQVLENLRLLEAIEQELSTARLELAHLINAPLALDLKVVESDVVPNPRILELPVEDLETVAIARNADLREQFYNTRIAQQETRKAMLRMFPSLNLSYTLKTDDDKYLVNQRWNEAGAQLSWNLLNLLTLPAQMRLADAGVALADQRRISTQMALLAQVHIARLQYSSALQQFGRADSIASVDSRISDHVKNRAEAQTQSKLEQVANNTAAILSLLRRYQALAQANAAASKLQASLGMEPEIGSVQDTSLEDLKQQIAEALARWNEGRLPEVDTPASQAIPAAEAEEAGSKDAKQG
ncbi:MAG: transporter [Betaproteobacteria bacterium HGW-Betaproteobacteria-13]|jgi:outer membrane protein TolC|nr:MAG: transporter [Betaproteobacteria bacterium HGW-Betaproteobacteria-21]PKO82065.1 MAG: transporter [Betaproteobacteria bacterium HGW-Betaproteobacteria-13]